MKPPNENASDGDDNRPSARPQAGQTSWMVGHFRELLSSSRPIRLERDPCPRSSTGTPEVLPKGQLL